MKNLIVFVVAISAPTILLATYASVVKPTVVEITSAETNATTANGGLY